MLEVPGGAVRAGEDSLEAVLREIKEETGLDVSGWTSASARITVLSFVYKIASAAVTEYSAAQTSVVGAANNNDTPNQNPAMPPQIFLIILISIPPPLAAQSGLMKSLISHYSFS